MTQAKRSLISEYGDQPVLPNANSEMKEISSNLRNYGISLALLRIVVRALAPSSLRAVNT